MSWTNPSYNEPRLLRKPAEIDMHEPCRRECERLMRAGRLSVEQAQQCTADCAGHSGSVPSHLLQGLTRSQRYTHRFGDAAPIAPNNADQFPNAGSQTPVAIDVCSGFDHFKYLPAILGYTFAGGDVSSMGLVFGAGNVACADAYVRMQLNIQASMAASGSVGGCAGTQSPMLCVIDGFLRSHNIDADRVQAAGARMTAHGWWTSSNWYFYWQYLSGYKPFYRNPLAIAATAAAGLGGWYAYKKWGK